VFYVVLQQTVHFVYDTVSIRFVPLLNKYLRIYTKLCHAQIIPEQNASKIVLKKYLNRWRSYVEK